MTTSIQYLDHTAVAYLHGICDDWQMRFVDWFSATVYIPLNQEKLKNVHTFFNQFVNSIRNQTATVTTYPQLPTLEHKYIDSHVKSVPHSGNRKIVLLTDSTSSNPSLENMIKTFEHFLANPVERIDLASYKLGDCLGCLNCSFNNTCVHKDDFRDLFEQHIIKADAIVFAGQIVDRFLSSKMKLFLDRSFYYNHIPVLKGKQMGLLVSGPVSMAPQIIEVYRAFSEMHQAHLGGFVSDERKQASTTTSALQIFANQLVQNIDVNYIKPQTFLGIGGSKIFRDFSYMLRYPFVAEYKHFKKTLYDSFPQNRKKVIFKSSLLYWLAHLKKDRRTVMKLSRQKGLSVFRDSFDNPN